MQAACSMGKAHPGRRPPQCMEEKPREGACHMGGGSAFEAAAPASPAASAQGGFQAQRHFCKQRYRRTEAPAHDGGLMSRDQI